MANPLRSELSGSARNFGGSLRSFFTNLPGAARGYRSPVSGVARGARAIGDFSQPLGSPLSPPAPQPAAPVKLANAFKPMAEPSQSFFGQQQESPVNIDYGALPGIQVTPPSFAAPQARQVPAPPQPMRPPAPQFMDPGVPLNPSPLSPPVQQQPVQPMNPQFAAAGQLADQIAARRAAGLGVGAGPTAQDMQQYNAAVQSRLANPSPGSLGDFTRGEFGRTEAGREARRQAMDQSYLSKPMQGGGFSMADREARLSMLSPPGQRAQADSDFMARRTRTGNAADEAVRAELERQGVTQEQLDSIAELRNDPDIAMGGRRAVSLLAPGTSIRTPEGGFIMRGADRELTQEDLERKAKGRVRDQFAPQERMARMRAGRKAMAMNQMAAQRQAYDMATNPLVNPMLLAGNPQAMTAAVNAMQDQRRLGFDREQFVEGKDKRAAEVADLQARTGLTKAMGELQKREFDANEAQRVANVDLTKAEAASKMESANAIRNESKISQDRLILEGDLIGAQAEKTRSEAIANKAEADARSMLANLETRRFDAEEPMRKAQVVTETNRGEAIRQEPLLARDQFNAGAGQRTANEAATLAQAQSDLAQATRFSTETSMMTDEKQRQVAQLQGAIDSLSGASDPQSIAARNRLVTQQMDILGNQAGMGQPSPLLPPTVRQPVAPNPETGKIDTAQVKAKVEQLAAYGMKGPELAAQLEALGVDRASLADFLRNEFRDMRWPRSSGPKDYVEAGRSLREVFGIQNDFMGYGR